MASIPISKARSALSYYWFSMAVSAAAVALAGALWGLAAAWLTFVLIILETSLSLDNAVVNAKILENWDERWRRIFLTVGILIAVFGMRLLFPILVVTAATGIGPVEVTNMALTNPDQYARHMMDAHYIIAGFGGAFLLMVGLSFFFEERDQHWFEWAERKLTSVGQMEGISIAVTLAALFGGMRLLDPEHQTEYFMAGALGIVVFVLAHGAGTLFGGTDDEDEDRPSSVQTGGKFVKAGLAGFLYIELLDASFSFDGVIGAFVLTKYLPIIMLGLGAGAFFVRSFTIHLVETGKLAELRYLESGAFYAIMVLAVIMLLPGLHLPEWLVGLSGAVILGVALWHSLHANKREAVA